VADALAANAADITTPTTAIAAPRHARLPRLATPGTAPRPDAHPVASAPPLAFTVFPPST